MIQTFIGDYSLSFLRKGKVWHVPIKSRQRDNGAIRFYLVDQVFFDSLYSLITHYQQNPLVSPKFSITLGRAVPPPNQGWFFKTFFVSFHTTFLPNEGGR